MLKDVDDTIINYRGLDECVTNVPSGHLNSANVNDILLDNLSSKLQLNDTTDETRL